ncbi:MAG: FAD-dependent oxidoreductase [Chloroflexi bacterium]|nr:FAD-dependent oxidoreductase [Chloroflexota bacterium]
MQLAFYFDQTRCTGCYACGVACKDWNDIPAGPAHWRRIVHIEEGEFPHPFVANMSGTCATVCPAGAITKRDEDGIVLVDREKCRVEARCGLISGYEPPFALAMGERDAPCQVTCPVHLRIPAYIRLIAKGSFGEALDLIRRHMPLPSVCGRICTHPCEAQCARGKLDEPLAVAALRRFVADHASSDSPQRVPTTKNEKVAIVGSGPAGLAAAYNLVRMGYGATIFEALPVAGGMLAVGIPEYRLPKVVLERDINHIRALGVEIRTSTPVGPELTLDDLARLGYSATFIAVGAHKGLKLDVPGEESPGVMQGVDFLRAVNLGHKVEIGRRVAVIGGGNTAVDAARVARRLGSAATIVYRRTRKEMPANRDEIAAAEAEGIEVMILAAPAGIASEGGKVTGLECIRMKLGDVDASGRPRPVPIEGSQFILDAGTVIVAVGQTPELDFVGAIGGLRRTKSGLIAADPETLETSRAGVFAGGDAVSPAGAAIEAIAAGQRAAIYIDRYLKGEVLKGGPQPGRIKASDIKIDMPPEIHKAARQRMPSLSPAERILSFAEVALGFDAESAKAEAERCLNCAGSLCRDVCPYGAPQFGSEDNARMQKCHFCIDRWLENKPPICVAACPMRALDAGSVEMLGAKYGGVRETAGFAYSTVTAPPTVFKAKRR